jgi:DNA repair protein RadC
MKRILHHQKNGLMDLENISLQSLMQLKGVGLAKAIKIIAALEL